MIIKRILSQVTSRWCLLLLLVASRTPLVACPYSIRDSAFIAGTAASPYQLRILVKGDGAEGSSPTTDRIKEWLSVGASAWLEDANVEARVLDVADPATRDALPEGVSIPSDLPTAILVSPRGVATTLQGIAPGRVSLDTVMATALASSSRHSARTSRSVSRRPGASVSWSRELTRPRTLERARHSRWPPGPSPVDPPRWEKW